MNRKLLMGILLLLVPLFTWQDTETVEDGLREILGNVDLSEWDDWFSAQNGDSDFVPSDFLTAAVLEGNTASEEDWTLRLKELALEGVKTALWHFGLYLGVGVFAALASALRQGELDETVDRMTATVGGCLVMGLFLPLLREAHGLMQTAENGYSVLFPVLMGILVLFGMQNGAAVMEPMTAVLSGAVLNSMRGIVFPLCVVGGIFAAMNGIGGDRMKEYSKLCLKLAKWVIGVVSSLYLTVTAIRSSVAIHTDTLLLRTTKLATGSLPFVGGLVSDSVDTAFRCIVLVKNAIGITGILLLLLVVLKPIVHLVMERCALKLASVLSAPFCRNGYPSTLELVGNALGIVTASVIAVLVMGIGTVGLLMGVGQTG